MNKETLRMQMLSGVITEGQYKAKLEENIHDLTPSHKGSHSTGRPDFNKMTADEIEDYLEKDKDNPGGLYGRSLSIVKHILDKKRKEETEKESLNEHYIAGGIVGVGAINNPFEGRKKESYEDAFEHFLGQKYALNEEEDVEEGKEVEEPSLYEEKLTENAGTSIDNFINSFDFSQKGNDELIDFAHRLLNRNVSSEEFEKLKSYFGNDLEFFNFVSDPSKGVKAIAQQIYQKLKQGVGNTGKIETWATDPMALQSLQDKLK